MKRKILLFAVMIGAVGLLCAGCGKKIRSMKEVLDSDDPFIQDMTDIDQKTLRKAWGEPAKTTAISDIWQTTHNGETAYIEAGYDENGNVITVGHSYPFYVIVADVDRRVGVFSRTGYDLGSEELVFIPQEDIFGNPIDIAYGDQWYLLFSGLVMETWPSQIYSPYSAEKTGTVSDQDLPKLEAIAKLYQDFCDQQ